MGRKMGFTSYSKKEEVVEGLKGQRDFRRRLRSTRDRGKREGKCMDLTVKKEEDADCALISSKEKEERKHKRLSD